MRRGSGAALIHKIQDALGRLPIKLA